MRPKTSPIEKKKGIEILKIKSENSARKNRNQLERLRQKENSSRPAPIGVENSIRAIWGDFLKVQEDNTHQQPSCLTL